MAKRRAWQEEPADAKEVPGVVKITGKMSKRWAEGTVVIPAPAELDAIMRAVPAGRLIPIDQIRGRLARKLGATIACPISIGIFAFTSREVLSPRRAGSRKTMRPFADELMPEVMREPT
ncbi:MAG TPA: hypothetical protein VKT78_18780 [Fimbriimonadaceae bacterium]|nr:hypothetical protein [Fimbriimonadaceae bacterium]